MYVLHASLFVPIDGRFYVYEEQNSCVGDKSFVIENVMAHRVKISRSNLRKFAH